MASLELSELSKNYGSVAAVRGLSLRIDSGEFVALLGPSGCGKTTTLQMVAGFVMPTSGEIRVDGRSITQVPPHRRNIGVVFQSYALFPHLTVFDNVAFGLRMRRLGREEIHTRVRRALDSVRLGPLDQRHPRELSGGQQQRVALARALVIEPSLLLLDEPLSNLDAQLREQMRFEIRQIQRSTAITTLFVTHDQSEAMAAADRLVVMAGGSMRQTGSARDIYEHPADRFVASFIGQANMLSGRVLDVSGTDARIEVAGLGRFVARNRDDLKPNDPAVLVLRPEELRFADAVGSHDNAIVVGIVRVSYLGASTMVAVRSGETLLSVLAERGPAVPAEGEPVTICWPSGVGVLLRDTV